MEPPFKDASKTILDPPCIDLDVLVEGAEAPCSFSSLLHELADALVVPPRNGGKGLCVVAALAMLVDQHRIQHGLARVLFEGVER